ncbi:MAG: hypothetical protein WAO83_22205 [Fuerstiella sp.]
MAENLKLKKAYFDNAMKKRGLPSEISDDAYLAWWRKKLGIAETP